MNSEHKQLARVSISVRWRDMDSMGHVNNAKYISYLEEARVRWMLTVPEVSMTDRIAPVVAANNINATMKTLLTIPISAALTSLLAGLLF